MDKIHGNYLNQLNPDFPLDCETLQYIQHNEMMCEVLGNIAGDKVILMGCTLNQAETERAEGYVFIRTVDYPNGEILPFVGGAVANGFHLEKTDINVSAGAVTYNKAYTQRRLVAGTDNSEGAENFTWNDFVELTTTKGLLSEIEDIKNRLNNIVEEPIGVIKICARATLPQNYLYCDGANLQIPQSESDTYWKLWQAIGTTFNIAGDVPTPTGYFALPDLSGRFIVGKGTSDKAFAFKEKGGASKVQLAANELPVHSHVVPADDSIVGMPGYNTEGYPSNYVRKGTGYSNDGDGGVCSSSTVGGNQSHENLPPYFTLSYIIRYR
jgi:microcystin-dependent protein